MAPEKKKTVADTSSQAGLLKTVKVIKTKGSLSQQSIIEGNLGPLAIQQSQSTDTGLWWMKVVNEKHLFAGH